MAAWQWFNLHRDNANEGEIVINLDETSINLGCSFFLVTVTR